jgi:iron complex outermembrane recepter protein
MAHRIILRAHIAAVGMAVAFAGQDARAQSAASGALTLEEVVVTAQRRTDTVHNIPMSIAAVTPDDIENKGIKTAQDLARFVPALRVGTDNSSVNGNLDIAVRGIRGGAGAATTGVYIDDVSITQRTVNNPMPGGTVIPQLIDLERVEVLRGPQGTLYGGSSEGGTIRLITPGPNMTSTSGRVRVEGTSTRSGDPSYDVAGVFGMPIVADKLGFRVSAEYRKDGGYIDNVSRFTGNTIGRNLNDSSFTTLYASLAWVPVDDLKVTFNYFYTKRKHDTSDSYWDNIPAFTARTNLSAGPNATLTNYGPFNMFGPYNSGLNSNIGDAFYTSDAQLKPLLNRNSHDMKLPSLVIDYANDVIALKAVTSYVETNNQGAFNYSYADVVSQTGAGSPFLPNLREYSSVFNQNATNKTKGEEIRLSSNNPEASLKWLVGLYYNKNDYVGTSTINANLGDALSSAIGVPFPPSFNGVILNFPEQASEKQYAVFTEATYAITPKWKATAGLRYTDDEVSIQAFQGGALFNPGNPTLLLQSANVKLKEKPVTPKFGMQYLVDADLNFYLNAAKGFRAGGANNDLRQSTCVSSLIQTFGAVNNQPLQFSSDSLWSYEAGAKSRPWGGRATIDASVFYIDWKNPQTRFFLPCAQPINISANANIVSKGADLSATLLVMEGLTANLAVGYTDAKWDGAVNTGPGTPTIYNEGDRIPYTPKWTVAVAGEYDFTAFQRKAFVRADFQMQSSFVLGTGVGTTNWNPDNFDLPSSESVNMRMGIALDFAEIALFVNNVTDSTDKLDRTGLSPGAVGRTGCLNGSCSQFLNNLPGAQVTTFRPRTFGLTLNRRF